MARVTTKDAVRVEGLRELQGELRKLDDNGLIEELKDANFAVASLVVTRAKLRARAMGGMEAKAAATLTARRGQRRAEVSFGGTQAPFAAGAEFGAYQDKLRLVKAKTGAGTSRSYIVRNESARGVAAARKRIEAQKNINTGERITVTGQVRGWNQFRPWRGNKESAGYWLFPAIRQAVPEIVDTYGEAIEKITSRAFPD